jgi:hypothetical protein
MTASEQQMSDVFHRLAFRFFRRVYSRPREGSIPPNGIYNPADLGKNGGNAAKVATLWTTTTGSLTWVITA